MHTHYVNVRVWKVRLRETKSNGATLSEHRKALAPYGERVPLVDVSRCFGRHRRYSDQRARGSVPQQTHNLGTVCFIESAAVCTTAPDEGPSAAKRT